MELLNRRQTFRTLLCRALALLLLMSIRLAAQSAGEYELKAAFLYKFASFVEWPDAPNNGAPCIGVLGEDPFGPNLEEAVKGKSYRGRSFEIRRFKLGQEPHECQILFIGALEPKKLRAVLKQWIVDVDDKGRIPEPPGTPQEEKKPGSARNPK